MKPHHISHRNTLRALPLLGLGLLFAPVAHAQAAQAAASLTPAMLQAACAAAGLAGGAAGAAAGPAGALAGGALAGLCQVSGVPLQAISGLVGQLTQALQKSGGGESGGGSSSPASSYTPGYNQVSGLPVIAQPQPVVSALDYKAVGTTVAPKLPDYGPIVPVVARREETAINYGVVGTSGGQPGGVRLPNGQPARESGIRLGGYAEGRAIASLGTGSLNVGTSVATFAGEQKIDWFTLGYDDGQNGRKKQTFADAAEQYQYDSGFALGQQYPLEKPVA